MRDFLYVSERKVDRIAQTLPPHVTRRLKELNFKAGPVGAGLVLADSRADTTVLRSPKSKRQSIASVQSVAWPIPS